MDGMTHDETTPLSASGCACSNRRTVLRGSVAAAAAGAGRVTTLYHEAGD